MQAKGWIATAAGGLAVVALLAWAFAPRPVEVEVAPVTRGAFETTIEEGGKTRLADRYVVSAPLAGRLARITLREGDTVAAGAVVATLLPVLPAMLDERTLREQQLRVEIAQAQLQRAQARTEAARLASRQAGSKLQRSEQLARQGFISPTQLETDQLSAQGSRKELDAAVEEQRAADTEVQQTRAALMAVRAPGAGTAARAFELRAPVAGRVLRVLLASETVVTLGTPLIEIGDTTRLEVVAELLTSDALQARPGSTVVIDRWGGPAALQGRVRAVEPAAYTKVSALGVEEQRVKVLIDLVSPAEQWRALGDGYRVGVRIVTQAVPDALKLPVSAVFPLPQAGGGMAAFVVDGSHARLTPVQLLARNGSHAWVRDGPAPGTEVVVYPPATVKDGARIKVRKV